MITRSDKYSAVLFKTIIVCLPVLDAASADSTVYAKAVRDHFNVMDSTALPFKTGETIIVRH